MKWLISILMLALMASVASAADPVKITVFRLDSGYYVIQGGEIVAFPPNGPIVPPDVPNPPTTEFSKAVTAAVTMLPANDQRHAAALKLAAVYRLLAQQVKDGKIHPTSAVKGAELLCPAALGADSKDWGGVFLVVNAAVGKAGTPDATAAVFVEAADTVQSTTPAGDYDDMQMAASRYGFDWDKFMTFLMQLLQVLLPLIIS